MAETPEDNSTSTGPGSEDFNLDDVSGLPEDFVQRSIVGGKMSKYLTQSEAAMSGHIQNKQGASGFKGNINPFVDQEYDLNEMVEGGEYEDEKLFDPLSELKTKDNPYGLDANRLNGVDFYAKLSELNLKQGTLDYEDELEENQGFFEELTNTGIKFWGKVANYTGLGIAGFVWGAGKAIVNWDINSLMDNEVFRGMDQADEWFNKRFVVHGGADYRLAQENDAGIVDRFLLDPTKVMADDISNAGSFVASAIVTEVLLGAATVATIGGAGPALAANTARLGVQGARLFSTGVRVLRGIDKMADMGAALRNATRFKNMAGTGRAILTGAGFESAMIGRETKDRVIENLVADYEDYYGRPPSETELAEYEELGNSAMRQAYALNLPLVAGSNMLQFPKLFIKGYSGGRKLVNGLRFKGGKWAAKYDEFSKIRKAGLWTKKSLGRGVTEAWEEYAQGAMEEGLVDYFSSNYSADAAKNGVSWLDAMSTAGSKYLGTTEGQDSATIGFLMGMVGMPMPFKMNQKTGKIEKGFGWFGGVAEELSNQKRRIKSLRNAADMLNQTDAGQALAANYQNFIRNMAIEQDKDSALMNEDPFSFKNSEHDQLHSYAMTRHNMGLSDTMWQELDGLEKMSTEDFNKAYQLKGVDEWTDATKKEVLDKTRAKLKRVVKVAEDVDTHFNNKVISNVPVGEEASYAAVKEQLTYLASTIDNVDTREKELEDKISNLTGGNVNSNSIKASKTVSGINEKTGEAEFGTLRNPKGRFKSQDAAFKKQMEEWKENDPGGYALNKDEVTDLYNDTKKLSNRRREAGGLYEFLFTKEGSESFKKVHEKLQKDFAKKVADAVKEKVRNKAKGTKNQTQSNRNKRDAESTNTDDIWGEEADQQAAAANDNVISKKKGPLADLASDEEVEPGIPQEVKGIDILENIAENRSNTFLNKILDEAEKRGYNTSGINSIEDILNITAFQNPELFAELQRIALEMAQTASKNKTSEREQASKAEANNIIGKKPEENTTVSPGDIIKEQEDTSTEDEFVLMLGQTGDIYTKGENVTEESIILITHDKSFDDDGNVITYKGRPLESRYKGDQPELLNSQLNNPNFLSDSQIEKEGGSVEVTIVLLNNNHNSKPGNQNAEGAAFGIYYDGIYLGMLPEYQKGMPGQFLELRKKAFEAGANGNTITHSLIQKINTRVNTQRNNTGKPVRNNPLSIIKQAIAEGASFITKKGGKIPLKLWLVSNVRDKHGTPVLKTNGLSKTVVDNIAGDGTKLQEGHIYMLVPHPKGLFPVRLFSQPFSNVSDKAKSDVKNLLDTLQEQSGKDENKYKEAKARLGDVFHNVTFDFYDGRYIITSENPAIVEKWGGKVLPQSETSNSEYIVMAMGDLVPKVAFNKMNNTGTQGYYVNNGFVTTDVFSEDGNFFHSSGFTLDSYSSPESKTAANNINEQEDASKADSLEDQTTRNEAVNDSPAPLTTVLSELQVARWEAEGEIGPNTLQKVIDKFNNQEEELTTTEQEIINQHYSKIAEEVADVAIEDIETPSPEKQIDTDGIKGILPGIDPENSDDSNLRTRMTDKTDGTTFSESEEVQWLEDKLGKEVVGKTKMFNSLEDLKSYLPKQVYQMLLNARKNGKNLHGLFSNAALYLNSNAFEGTAYHEAFHVVFHLTLSPKQRAAILKEARTKYKSELAENASEIEVEELLADKFMEYVQSEEGTRKTLSGKIKNWFRSTYRMIKTFFNGNNNISIDEVFENIQLGVYKNKPKFQSTNLTELTNPVFRTALREESYENVAEESQALEYLRSRYFGILDILRKQDVLKDFKDATDSELINKVGVQYMDDLLLTQLIGDINNLKADLNTNLTENRRVKTEKVLSLLNKLKKITTNNGVGMSVAKDGGMFNLTVGFNEKKPDFMNKFHRLLKGDGLNIRTKKATGTIETYDTDQLTNEAEESTQEENWQRSNIEINPKDTLSDQLKRFFNSVPKYTRTKEGYVPATNAFGVPLRESSARIFSYLGEKITNSTEGVDQMMEKLNSLKNDKPFVKHIIEKLSDPANESVKSDLYVNLASKQFIKFLSVLESNDEYRVFFSNRKSAENLITEELVANFLNERNKLFTKRPGGGRNFESVDIAEARRFKELIGKTIKYLQNIKPSNESEKLNDKFFNGFAKALSGTGAQNNLGFNLTADQIKDNLYKEIDGASAVSVLRSFVNTLDKLATQLEQGKNPFLFLKATDQVDTSKVGSKNIVEELAKHYSKIFQGEVQSAFRNVENKTVYNIQLANFLSQAISKFKNKKQRQDFLRLIANDPLLSNSPFLNDLAQNEKLQEELDVVLLDGFKRQGKSRGVKYTKLSNLELEATSMGAFLNQSKNSSYGYYRLPIPADSPTIPFIKMGKYTNEEILDKLVEVARGEFNRTKRVMNLPENAEIKKIKNFSKNFGKFNLLPFLNGKVNYSEKFNEKQVRSTLEKWLNDETSKGFFGSQLEAYTEKGIIKNIEGNKITFAEKVLDKRIRQEGKGFFKNYLFNSLYANTQLTTLFSGDPAFYGGTVDYQKRNKQILSPKLYLDTSKTRPNYYLSVIADNERPSEQELVDTLTELIESSDLPADKQTELLATWTATDSSGNLKTKHNETDAQTYIHPRRYKEIMEGLNRWSDKLEASYQRVLQGKETIEDIAAFPPIKPFMYTQNRINGFVVPVQIKNSEIMLTPSMALAKEGKELKYPKLAEVYQAMEKERTMEDGTVYQIDSIAFESAVKVGGDAIAPTMEDIDGARVLTLKNSDFGLQQETPPHYLDDVNNYGTQLRNLILADINLEGDYVLDGQKLKGKDIARLYQETIAEDLKASFDKYKKLFETKDGKVNYEALIDTLQNEVDRRDLGDNARAAIAAIKVNQGINKGEVRPALPFYHPAHSIMIQNILNGLFKKNVTRQKVEGGALINTSSYGVSDTLKWHKNKKGELEFQVLLPWWSKKYFPKNEKGEVDITKLPDELKELVGYRIPTEDKYSMFKMKVVGFTPATMGGTLIMPREVTTIAGLDFDIDKIFVMTPAFNVSKDGKLSKVKPLTNNTSPEVAASKIFNDIETLEKFVNENVDNKEAEAIMNFRREVNEAVAENQKLKRELFESEEHKDIYNEIQLIGLQIKNARTNEEIPFLVSKRDNLYEQLKDSFAPFNAAIEEIYNNKASYKQMLEGIIRERDVDLTKYNGKRERDNLKLDIVSSILGNKHTAKSLVSPGNFQNLIDLANKIRLLQAGKEKEALSLKGKKLKETADALDDTDTFNVVYPSTQLELFERNMAGIELTGIFANQNTHAAKAQYTQMELKLPILVDGQEYMYLNKSIVGDTRISEKLASYLAAVVDNAKEPMSAFINLNTFTADTVALLTRLGVEEDTVAYLMNQPVIKELTKLWFQEKGNLSEENVFGEILELWKDKMLSKSEALSLEEIDNLFESGGVELNKNKLRDNLLPKNQGTAEFYKQQYIALLSFESLSKTAKELSESIQASRVDTKGLGATMAEGYVFLDQQRRLIQKEENNENLIFGITETFTGSEDQIMMPAFNEEGIIKPLSLMDTLFPYNGKQGTEGEFLYNLLGSVKNWFSNQKGKTLGLTEREVRLIEAQYMGYISSNFPFFSHTENEQIIKETPRKLIDFKQKNPNSQFAPLLDSLYVKAPDKQFPLERIEYYKSGKTPIQSEQMIKSWEIMMTRGTKEEQDLAFDLVKYAYHSTGFEYTPYSFVQQIPTAFWTDDFGRDRADRGLVDAKGRTYNEFLSVADDYIRNTPLYINPQSITEKFSEKGGGQVANNFIHQFLRNNFDRDGFVKSVTARSRGAAYIKGKGNKPGFISITASRFSPFASFGDGMVTYVKRYNKNLKKNELFRFSQVIEGTAIYNKVEPLGTTNFLKVFNANGAIEGDWLERTKKPKTGKVLYPGFAREKASFKANIETLQDQVDNTTTVKPLVNQQKKEDVSGGALQKLSDRNDLNQVSEAPQTSGGLASLASESKGEITQNELDKINENIKKAGFKDTYSMEKFKKLSLQNQLKVRECYG